ncbi:hypothetical protein [Catellatospora sp. NPDC049609]|uniref:hypothetical protein n=1 Tax=Catellatospora sp. NPDC049609 TaxID=3155505 RepID=UPI0034263B6A
MSHNPYRAPLAAGRPALAAGTFTLTVPPLGILPAVAADGTAAQDTVSQDALSRGALSKNALSRGAFSQDGSGSRAASSQDAYGSRAERRRARVRRVRAGIGWSLAGHGVAVAAPVLPPLLMMAFAGPVSASGERAVVYVLGAIVAQLLLAGSVVRLGVLRTARRDGANAAGLAIGWIAGVPLAVLLGIITAVAVAL